MQRAALARRTRRRVTPVTRAIVWPFRQVRRLYLWGVARSQSRYALGVVGVVAFIESIIFFFPTDYVLVPMALASPWRWWVIALVATGGSVLGALVSYGIGYGLFEVVGWLVVDEAARDRRFAALGETYQENAFWAIVVSGLLSIVFKVFAVAAGLFQVPLLTLIAAAVVGRGLRFALICYLVSRFGTAIIRAIDRYFNAASTLVLLLVAAGLVYVLFIA